jgi:hypothetical protein
LRTNWDVGSEAGVQLQQGSVPGTCFSAGHLPANLESACVSKSRHSAVEIRRGKWEIKAERTVSAKEYRDNVVECMGWARTARSDRERAISYRWQRLGISPLKGPTAGKSASNLNIPSSNRQSEDALLSAERKAIP